MEPSYPKEPKEPPEWSWHKVIGNVGKIYPSDICNCGDYSNLFKPRSPSPEISEVRTAITERREKKKPKNPKVLIWHLKLKIQNFKLTKRMARQSQTLRRAYEDLFLLDEEEG